MALNLVDIIKNLIADVNLTIKVESIVGAQVFVCGSTLHITVGKIVTDSFGNEYTVTNMLIDEWLELTPISPAPAFFDTVLNAPPITFLHGTPQTTNNEYLQLDLITFQKVPFMWLLESYSSNLPEADSALGGIFEVVIFVLDWCDEESWSNTQHNDLVIKPMQNLASAFVATINDDFAFKRLADVTIRPRSRFGVEVTNKGNKRKIINEDLSGVEMRFTLEAFDLELCC